jgi:photosystem II stability/assembly factor-like uncharacterized protein
VLKDRYTGTVKWRVAAVLLLVGGLAGCDGGSSKGAQSLTPSPTAITSVAPSVAASPGRTPGPIQLATIQRLDARIGFVTGWAGTGVGPLAKTSDGGATWQRIVIPADRIPALRFIDERVGWAGGFVGDHDAVVLRTEDGGGTWQATLHPGGNPGYPTGQLQAVDGQRAWAVTTEPCPSVCPRALQRTTDGGKMWTTLLRGDIAAIRFASASRGWLALVDPPGSVEVKVTSDGGTTWTGGFRTTSPGLALDAATTQRAWFMTQDTAYCSMSNCTKYELFRTDDGGVTWSGLGNPKGSTAGCSGGFLSGCSSQAPDAAGSPSTLGPGWGRVDYSGPRTGGRRGTARTRHRIRTSSAPPTRSTFG